MSEIKEIIKKIKEKRDNLLLSKFDGVLLNYWDKFVKLSGGIFNVNIKNAEDIKTTVDFSSLEIPKSFKIDNLEEIAEYIVIPKSKEFPKDIKISNLAELAKYIEVKEKIKIPDNFSINNLDEIGKVEFPENLKTLSLKKTEEVLAKLAKQLSKEKVSKNVNILNKKPEDYIPVRIVDRRGKDWLESFGNAVMGFPNKIGLFNVAGDIINPSTKEGQDSLLTELEKKADLTETQPVSNASLPLPTGASTEAKQDDIITELQDLAVTVDNVGSAVISGRKTVTTAGTAEILKTDTTLTQGVIIMALKTNTNNIFVGDSSLDKDSDKQTELEPGESTAVAVDNTNLIYIDVTTNGEGVSFIGS